MDFLRSFPECDTAIIQEKDVKSWSYRVYDPGPFKREGQGFSKAPNDPFFMMLRLSYLWECNSVDTTYETSTLSNVHPRTLLAVAEFPI